MSSHRFFVAGCAVLALAGGVGVASGGVYAAEGAEKEAGFEDSVFYTCVTKAAGVEAGTVLTNMQLSAIETVNCGATSETDGTIKSLVGLEKLTGIKNLVLANRGIAGEIDFGSNLELTSLDVSGNELDAIDLSKNAKLESLIAKESGLIDLDVTKNPLLKNLVLKDVSMVETGLKGTENASGEIVYDYSNIKFLQNGQGSSVKHIIEKTDCSTVDEEHYKLTFASRSCLDFVGPILYITVDDGAGSAQQDEYIYATRIANSFAMTFTYKLLDDTIDEDEVIGAAYTIYYNDVTRAEKSHTFTLPDGFDPLKDEGYEEEAKKEIKKLKDAGYKFLGWTDEEGGTEVKYKAGSKFEITYDEETSYNPVFYPVWEKSSVKTNSSNARKSNANVKNPNTVDGVAASVVAAALAIGGVVLSAIKYGRRR